jgi:hypothetical protein
LKADAFMLASGRLRVHNWLMQKRKDAEICINHLAASEPWGTGMLGDGRDAAQILRDWPGYMAAYREFGANTNTGSLPPRF